MPDARRLSVAPLESIAVDELIVRRYARGDAPALVETVSRSVEHLRPWMPWIKFEPQSVEQRTALIDEWSKNWQECSDFTMGVFRGSVVVGGTGIHVRGDEGVLEIGYWVAVDQVGQGIATRVARALTSVALSLPGVEEVRIGHDINNVASGRVPEKLGYKIVDEHQREPEAPAEAGVVRYWAMSRGRWTELVTMPER